MNKYGMEQNEWRHYLKFIDAGIVRKILEKQFAEGKEKVSMYHVEDQLEFMVQGSILVGLVNCRYGDGTKNIREGAKKYFREAWKQLDGSYFMDEDGWITRTAIGSKGETWSGYIVRSFLGGQSVRQLTDELQDEDITRVQIETAIRDEIVRLRDDLNTARSVIYDGTEGE